MGIYFTVHLVFSALFLRETNLIFYVENPSYVSVNKLYRKYNLIKFSTKI